MGQEWVAFCNCSCNLEVRFESGTLTVTRLHGQMCNARLDIWVYSCRRLSGSFVLGHRRRQVTGPVAQEQILNMNLDNLYHVGTDYNCSDVGALIREVKVKYKNFGENHF